MNYARQYVGGQFAGAPLQLAGVHHRQYAGAPRQLVGQDPAVQNAAMPAMGTLQQPVVVDPGYRAVRRYPIGFGPLLVNPTTQLSFTAQPQELFRPSRLVIPSNVAASFLVNDLKIGMDSMLLSSNPVPAAMFIETAVDTWLGLSTANIGQLITLVVSNFTGTATNFLAGIAGASAI